MTKQIVRFFISIGLILGSSVITGGCGGGSEASKPTPAAAKPAAPAAEEALNDPLGAEIDENLENETHFELTDEVQKEAAQLK